MDDASWRVLVAFATTADARALAEYLERASGFSAVGATVSHASDSCDLYAYARTQDAIAQGRDVIWSGIQSLGLKPSRMQTDEWLSDQSRWTGDDAPSSERSGPGDVISEVIGNLGWLIDRP